MSDFCPFCHFDKPAEIPVCKGCWNLLPEPLRESIQKARRIEFTPTPGPQFPELETPISSQPSTLNSRLEPQP